MELVVLAGGTGARFGGNKQTVYIDDYNDYLLDYSIYNAIKCGFKKVVFLVNKQCYAEIKQKYTTHLNGIAECDFVIQDNERIFEMLKINRTKPLGTGYALLCLKNVVKSIFCIINADDYYGKNSFEVAGKYLQNLDKDSTNYAVVGYNLQKTLSQNGSVKRGICEQDKNGSLQTLLESIVEQKNDKIYASNLDGSNLRIVEPNTTVSMNMFCFNLTIFDLLQKNFDEFLKDEQNLLQNEFLVSVELQKLMDINKVAIKVLKTTDKWIGMTYKEDKPFVVSELKKLVDNKEFPNCVYKNFDK